MNYLGIDVHPAASVWCLLDESGDLALENARFYATLQAQVDARTRELRETQARLVESEKLATFGRRWPWGRRWGRWPCSLTATSSIYGCIASPCAPTPLLLGPRCARQVLRSHPRATHDE